MARTVIPSSGTNGKPDCGTGPLQKLDLNAMSIIGVGIDLLHLPRISSLIKRRGKTKLAMRILSTGELADWELIPSADITRQTRYLAVRYVGTVKLLFLSIGLSSILGGL
jgi:hypothetical protein